METTKYQYTRTTHAYHNNYVRNSKAVGMLWGIFTVCFSILNIIVFIQPFWIGSTDSSPKAGVFGLYRYWVEVDPTVTLENQWRGQLNTFDTILSPYFKAATVLIGVSAFLIVICVACMILFFFLSSRSVYCLCSWIQLLSSEPMSYATEGTIYGRGPIIVPMELDKMSEFSARFPPNRAKPEYASSVQNF